MRVELLVSLTQLGASICRLMAFAFAVLAIGKATGDTGLLLMIGYLPYLTFFDILVQSSSRASYLHAPDLLRRVIHLRTPFALMAVAILVIAFAAAGHFRSAAIVLILGAWPLGAIGYLWESWIANRTHQAMLACLEIILLATAVGMYMLKLGNWTVLLLCIISAPVARLAVLAFAVRAQPETSATPKGGREVRQAARRRLGAYVTASLAQQLVGATAASLPALYAQLSGNVAGLPVQLALFRTLHSLAAVASLAINAMSSRIFFNQISSGIAAIELAVLRRRTVVIAAVTAFSGIAAILVLIFPSWPAAAALGLLPIMVFVNLESSMLYNRGLPEFTLRCQIMIFLLSLAFLFALVAEPAIALVALAAFVGYFALATSGMFHAHRQCLS